MEREHRLLKYLNRFFVKRPERRQIAEELIEENTPKAEVFRQVSRGLGVGKSHASGKPEGRLKDN